MSFTLSLLACVNVNSFSLLKSNGVISAFCIPIFIPKNIANIINTNINVFVPFINHFFFIISINLFGFLSFFFILFFFSFSGLLFFFRYLLFYFFLLFCCFFSSFIFLSFFFFCSLFSKTFPSLFYAFSSLH